MSYANFLASQRAKEILSRGENTEKELDDLLQSALSSESEGLLECAQNDFALLERHTFDSPPSAPGIYLRLLHGRSPSDQQLDDWGDDGPWIGPLRWFHCTYLSTFSLGFVGGEEYQPVSDRKIPAPIYFYDEMIYFRGMYYGDWEIQTFP